MICSGLKKRLYLRDVASSLAGLVLAGSLLCHKIFNIIITGFTMCTAEQVMESTLEIIAIYVIVIPWL